MVAGSNPAERTVDRDRMTTEGDRRKNTRRHDDQLISDLVQSVKDSNASLEALSGALMQFAIHAEERTASVEHMVNTHRRLSKYSRRTHFWTMAAMVFGALLLADWSQHAQSVWWDLVFWAHNHGHGGTSDYVLRALGLAWQAGYLFFLVKIAQVPEDLWDEIPAAQIRREREAGKRRFRLY